MTKYIKNPEDMLNLSSENVERIRRQSERLSLPVINNGILELSKTMADAKWSTYPRVLLELSIVRLASGDGAQGPMSQRMAVPRQPVAPPQAQSIASEEEKPTVSAETKAPEEFPPWEVPEEPAAPAAPEAPAEAPDVPEALDVELEDLWLSIFDDPSAKKGSFLLLRMGSKLRCLTDTEFFVEAGNTVTRDLLKSNERLLVQLMEQRTGRHLRMVLEDDHRLQEEDKQAKAEHLAASIGETLGIKVEVK